LATPLLLACLAGLFSERAGIFDIGLEGKMLAGAFAAGAVSAVTGSAWFGLFAGILASCLLALIHGFASITLKGNQLISGVAINFLASGLTALAGQNWFGMGGQTPQLQGAERFLALEWPLVPTLQRVPVLGPIYKHLISGHNILVYLALLSVPATAWVLSSTRFGLRLRAVGENPAAVDTAGVSVVRLRYAAVMIAGVLCGVAGAYLSTGMAASFIREMTAGKGFIALAALIFAHWRPWPALWACLLFGFLEAFGIRYQSISVVGVAVPVQFMQALPYILTVIILAGFVGKAVPPRAGGTPYVKER
jgi:simple sugar transport system permease protein